MRKPFLIFTLLAGISVIILAQFSIPTIYGADGYLHIRVAKFLRQFGPHYDFHWAKFSVFAQNYADKDFLYHALLIPFTFFPDIFFGAKVSAALFTCALFLCFWVVLERNCGSKALIPFFLLAFLCSAAFLQAVSQARNMIIVLGLTLIFTDALIRKRQWVLFFISLILCLTHVSGPYLLIFVCLAEAVRFFNERQFVWRSVASTAAGIIAGFLVHPDFPNNLLIFYLNGILVPVFALKWGLELGAEFFPMDTRELAFGYPFIIVGLVLFIALGANQKAKAKTSTQIWMAIAGFFLIFSFFSRRYFIHAYPLLLVAVACYISDWLDNRHVSLKARNSAIVAACVLLCLLGASTFKEFKDRMASEKAYNQHYEAVGKWMDRYIPAGETVFHANWSDSQYFIGLNPKDDYFVTLDPVYMYYWNPKVYELYRQTAFGNNPDPYGSLKNVFKVKYGYVGKNYFSGLVSQIKKDARFEVMAEDGLGLVFRLR